MSRHADPSDTGTKLHHESKGGAVISSSVIDADLFRSHLGANSDAFAKSRFNIAYITLAAAMHEAKGEANIERLQKVAHLAEEQLSWIDANAPGYEHSTESCRARRTTSIYQILAQRARDAADRLTARVMGMERRRKEREEAAALATPQRPRLDRTQPAPSPAPDSTPNSSCDEVNFRDDAPAPADLPGGGIERLGYFADTLSAAGKSVSTAAFEVEI